MSDLTICCECGAVEERQELVECELRDKPARICVRCAAGAWEWFTPRPKGGK